MRIRILLISAIVLLYIGSITGSYIAGRNDGKASCTNKALTIYKEEVQKNAKKDREVDRMDESDLDNALSRWMR